MNVPILSLVMPCYNEEDCILDSLVKTHNYVNNLIDRNIVSSSSFILIVDDGSTDKSSKIIQSNLNNYPNLRYISLAGNRGHQVALMAGYNYCDNKCDICITLDIDLQDDYTIIESMVAKVKAGTDIVYGVRKSRKVDSVAKKLTAEMFYRFQSFIGLNIVENHADFRALSSEALYEICQFKEHNLYLRGLVKTLKLSEQKVYYDRKERSLGYTKYTPRKMLELAVNGIFNFSPAPLRCITALGLLSVIMSIIGIIWSVFQHFHTVTVPGWTSLMCAVLFVGGLNSLAVGILGEYVYLIFAEVKNRPLYFIKEEERTSNGRADKQ